MSYSDLVLLAIAGPFIGACIGLFIGGRMEASYWADHADNGDLHHRGTFYRITRKIGQRP